MIISDQGLEDEDSIINKSDSDFQPNENEGESNSKSSPDNKERIASTIKKSKLSRFDGQIKANIENPFTKLKNAIVGGLDKQ